MLTCFDDADVGGAKLLGFGVATVNDDVAACLVGRCPRDHDLQTGRHHVVPRTHHRVVVQIDSVARGWYSLYTSDLKVVQTIYYSNEHIHTTSKYHRQLFATLTVAELNNFIKII